MKYFKFLNEFSYLAFSVLFYIFIFASYCQREFSYNVNAFSIVTSSFYVLFFTGFLLLQALNFRIRYWLEIFSLSFIFSQIIYIIVVLFLFIFRLNLKDFTQIIFIINFLLLTFLIFKDYNSNYKFKIENLLLNKTIIFDFIIFIGLIYLVILGYRVSNYNCEECHLHLSTIRKYFHKDFVFDSMGYIKNAPMPNLLQGWEFIIAFVSELSSIDPIYVFLKIRFVIPILGLSSLFLLICAYFNDVKKSLYLIVMIYLIAFIRIHFTYMNIDILGLVEPSRGILHFMGTSHHIDAAVDIMLPTIIAFSVFVFNSKERYLHVCLSIFLFSVFTWHPRIYFINEIYIISFITLFLIVLKINPLKRSLYILLCYLPSVLFFAILNLTKSKVLNYENLYPSELNFKLHSLHNMFNNGAFLNFRFPGDFGQVTFVGLFASCLIIFSLKFLDLKNQLLSLFIIIFSIFVYFSTFLYYFTEAITYSEFMMGNAYFLYIPFYIIICSSFYDIYRMNSNLLIVIYLSLILYILYYYHFIINNIKYFFVIYLLFLILLFYKNIKKLIQKSY
jgi:hypothetical protein